MSNCRVVWANFVEELQGVIDRYGEIYLNTLYTNAEGEMIGSLKSSLLLIDLNDDDDTFELCADRDRRFQFDKEYWDIQKLEQPGVGTSYVLTSKDGMISQDFFII